jgi:hypothetical protein
MNALDNYLAKHFLNTEQFAMACRLTPCELSDLIGDQFIPQPSYVVSQSTVESYVFGKMQALGATDGKYFHPANKVWVSTARQVITEVGRPRAYKELKKRFATNLQIALSSLNTTTWRLCDSFDDNGVAIAAGLHARIESMWNHFLHGTFGLCVADPISEFTIARKEVLQEKLIALSDDGARTDFSDTEAQMAMALIDAYAKSTMPFSPIEYPTSSKKRLIEDLTARISVTSRHGY